MTRLGRLLAISLIATTALTGTIAAVSGSASAADTYVVRSGDSLGVIAARLDVALDDLLRLNNLTVRSVIHPGQRLLVPGTGGSSGGGSTGGGSRAGTTYVVKAGDSLGRIAQRHGVTLTALLQANNLRATSLILPGQQLTIPGTGTGGGSTGGGSTGGGSRPGSTYVVKAGDSLGRIAQRHGVTLAALLQANNLRATSLIVPGQQLTIPGTGTGGGSTGGGSTGGGTSGGGTGAATTYVVRSGDFFARIAANHGVTLAALLAANQMTANSLIVPGQVLRIPARGTTPPPTTRPPTTTTRPPTTTTRPPTTAPASGGGPRYTVRPGDSLGLIASQHGIELRSLLAANGMSSSSLIVAGQVINLPAGAKLNPIDRVLNYAIAQVGKPWRFFTRGPDYFDCSGLTTAAFAQIGVGLIHQSAHQAQQGRAVDFRTQPLRAGDLIFQDTDGDGIINHVGIALSPTTWVQARSIRQAVSIGPIPSLNNIVAVRRIL